MISTAHTTLTQFVIEGQRVAGSPADALTGVVADVALACKIMATTVSKWPLESAPKAGEDGEAAAPRRPEANATEMLLRAKEWSGHLGNTMWRGQDNLFRGVSERPRGGYVLAFEPIDRWTNLDVNVAVGSVFSIARAPQDDPRPTDQQVLQPGVQLACAGYAIYGPSTMLVLATEQGVNGFTLDHEVGEFVLTHPRLTIAADASDFAINASASRYWSAPIKRYVEECVAGRGGPRGRDFNMRWNGSLVTELHRTLIRGGVCFYPRDPEGRNDTRCLRLVYDASPVAFIIERAGGRASTGEARVLELEPGSLEQRVGIVFGARHEVELVDRYYREHAQGSYTSPLFKTRGLFGPESR
jgi:fructose-1,6-bisphosphatase I/sedoheptulose-1,7-bisphosphatase